MERPEIVLDHFKVVDADEGGYAMREGDLWLGVVDDGVTEGEEYTEAMFKLKSTARDMANVALIVYRATRACDEVPSALHNVQDRG